MCVHVCIVCVCVYLCMHTFMYIHDRHITHTPTYQDIKPRRQDPSRDFVNVWQEIGQQRIYVPSKQV